MVMVLYNAQVLEFGTRFRVWSPGKQPQDEALSNKTGPPMPLGPGS